MGDVVINETITSDFAPGSVPTAATCNPTFTITEPKGTKTYSYTYNFLSSTYDGGYGNQGGSAYNGNNAVSGYGGWYSMSSGGCGIGGGGFHGGSASSVVIKTRKSISGSGTVSLVGQAGFRGGDGGNGYSPGGQGGGAGGGSGGFGGNLTLLYKGSNSFLSTKAI